MYACRTGFDLCLLQPEAVVDGSGSRVVGNASRSTGGPLGVGVGAGMGAGNQVRIYMSKFGQILLY